MLSTVQIPQHRGNTAAAEIPKWDVTWGLLRVTQCGEWPESTVILWDGATETWRKNQYPSTAQRERTIKAISLFFFLQQSCVMLGSDAIRVPESVGSSEPAALINNIRRRVSFMDLNLRPKRRPKTLRRSCSPPHMVNNSKLFSKC